MTFDEQQEKIKQLEFVLSQILNDLPANRDWLNPDIEKLARSLVGDKTTVETLSGIYGTKL